MLPSAAVVAFVSKSVHRFLAGVQIVIFLISSLSFLQRNYCHVAHLPACFFFFFF